MKRNDLICWLAGWSWIRAAVWNASLSSQFVTLLVGNRRGSVLPLLDILEKQRKKEKKKARRPSDQRHKRRSRSCAQVYELLSFHQANWAFVFPRPKSQMVFGAFGTLQSQRLKKLSAVLMEAERRSRQQHFTAVIPHFKAAFNVVSVLLQLLCPSGSDLLGRAVIRPIKWD